MFRVKYPSFLKPYQANVAQLVEQLTRNEQVVRSIRIVGSIFIGVAVTPHAPEMHSESHSSSKWSCLRERCTVLGDQ
jgi:hypothetical protein